MKEHIEVFTDGACRGNPGPGGWGALLRFKSHEKEISGFAADTTNNRMELTAAIKALECLKKEVLVHLYTDSEYLRKGIMEWLPQWKRNAWKTSSKKAVKNQDLWMELDALNQKYDIQWHWVRGHSGHLENERVDALARAEIEKYS